MMILGMKNDDYDDIEPDEWGWWNIYHPPSLRVKSSQLWWQCLLVGFSHLKFASTLQSTNMTNKYDQQIWPTNMINKYDQERWSTNMINKYEQQIWSTNMINNYNQQIRSTNRINNHNQHYDQQIWSTYSIHQLSSYHLEKQPQFCSLSTLQSTSMIMPPWKAATDASVVIVCQSVIIITSLVVVRKISDDKKEGDFRRIHFQDNHIWALVQVI